MLHLCNNSRAGTGILTQHIKLPFVTLASSMGTGSHPGCSTSGLALPARETVEDYLSFWALKPTWETCKKLLAPDLGLVPLGHCNHLESEVWIENCLPSK